jgi:hypothetical protein
MGIPMKLVKKKRDDEWMDGWMIYGMKLLAC